MWGCAAVAVASGWIWSVTTPTLEVPDELQHVAYTKYFAETGHLPRRGASPPESRPGAPPFELSLVLEGIPMLAQGAPIWDPAQSRALRRQLDGRVRRVEEFNAGNAANNPPAYYVVEAIPYRVTRSANLLDRILAMRLFSALLAGLTTALCFLFVRELMPGTPWAWTVGALAVALQPLFGFMSGGVNPDGLVWVAAAALALALARIFRRGLTWRRVLAVAAALALGLATKGAMLGLIPGTAVGLAFAAWRLGGPTPRRAAVTAAVAAAALAIPVAGWFTFTEHTLHTETNPTAATGSVSAIHGVNIRKEVNYVWQFWLPRLPFQNDQFSTYPVWTIYFQGFVGRFGAFFFDFPHWVDWLALVIALGVLGLAGRVLWLRRAWLRPRLPELLTYLALAAGLAILTNIAGYQFREREQMGFEQTRYLFPLLPLYAALVAVAVRGAGRLRRHVAVGLVCLFVAHEVFSVLLTISHFYA